LPLTGEPAVVEPVMFAVRILPKIEGVAEKPTVVLGSCDTFVRWTFRIPVPKPLTNTKSWLCLMLEHTIFCAPAGMILTLAWNNCIPVTADGDWP